MGIEKKKEKTKMAVRGITFPNNITVWKRGVFTKIVNKKVETADANHVPGAGVVYGSTVGEVALWGAGATRPLGWLSFEDTHAQYIDGHTRATAFTTNDIIAIVSGPGTGIMARLTTSQTILEGDFLVSAANGMLQKASAATVTITSGSVTVMSDKAQPDEAVAGAYGAEGLILATADESKTTTSAADLIAVTSRI